MSTCLSKTSHLNILIPDTRGQFALVATVVIGNDAELAVASCGTKWGLTQITGDIHHILGLLEKNKVTVDKRLETPYPTQPVTQGERRWSGLNEC